MFRAIILPISGALDCMLELVVQCTHDVAGPWLVTSWMHCTTSCNTQSSAPEDGQNNFPKHVELTGIIYKPLFCASTWLSILFISMCTVKQISDNEIYLLIKYVNSVLWRVAKRLSYIEDARCLEVNLWGENSGFCQDTDYLEVSSWSSSVNSMEMSGYFLFRWRDSAAVEAQCAIQNATKSTKDVFKNISEDHN